MKSLKECCCLNTINSRNVIILFLFFAFFSPLLFKLYKIPLIIIIIYVMLLLVLFKGNLKINRMLSQLLILILGYNIILFFSTLKGLELSKIPTHVPSDPFIPEYENAMQIIVGFIYNNILFIYIFLFYFLINSNRHLISKLEKMIYFFSLLTVIVLIVEILSPNLHYKLLHIAGYSIINYFFLPRPVSIVLNSYLAAFFCAFFSFWSFYYWNKTKKKIFVLLCLMGIISVILAGARYALILLFIALFLYVFLVKKTKNLLFLLMSAFVFLVILFYLKRDYIDMIVSIFTLSDKVGSANTHKELFINTLKIFLHYPLGIGIGKADFGALNIIRESAYDSESFLLTVLLQGGCLSFIIYIAIHMMLLKTLLKRKLFHIFSFNLSVLLISLINIQILQSITSTLVISLLYVLGLIPKKIIGKYYYETLL